MNWGFTWIVKKYKGYYIWQRTGLFTYFSVGWYLLQQVSLALQTNQDGATARSCYCNCYFTWNRMMKYLIVLCLTTSSNDDILSDYLFPGSTSEYCIDSLQGKVVNIPRKKTYDFHKTWHLLSFWSYSWIWVRVMASSGHFKFSSVYESSGGFLVHEVWQMDLCNEYFAFTL